MHPLSSPPPRPVLPIARFFTLSTPPPPLHFPLRFFNPLIPRPLPLLYIVGTRDLRTLWSPPVSLNCIHVLPSASSVTLFFLSLSPYLPPCVSSVCLFRKSRGKARAQGMRRDCVRMMSHWQTDGRKRRRKVGEENRPHRQNRFCHRKCRPVLSVN